MKILILLVLLTSFKGIYAAEKPSCSEVAGEKGWVLKYDGSERFKPDANCSEKEVVCHAIGSRSEGWWAKEDHPIQFVLCRCE